MKKTLKYYLAPFQIIWKHKMEFLLWLVFVVIAGQMVINGLTRIGKNVNISPGVNIGQASRGKNKGVPIIGNDVYIGPGAKIIGAISIGNNVCIGANAVVTCDVPDNACVVGIPAKVISFNGAEGYIINAIK